MLRMLVVLLILANGLYFAWAQGHLSVWTQALGLDTAQTPAAAEPDKLAQYAPLHPEAIQWTDAASVAQTQMQTPARVAAAEPAVAPTTAEIPATAEPSTERAMAAETPLESQSEAEQDEAPEAQSATPTPTPLADPAREDANAPPPAITAAEPQATASAAEPIVALPPETPKPEVPKSEVPKPEVPKQCMEIGPFSPEQMEPIRQVLQGIARNQWRIDDSPVSGRWMVFWGGANDELVLSARRGELQNKAVPHERLRSSPVGIGFSLGRFSSEAAAQQHKRDIERKGIRGATVEVERAPSTLYTIEFPDYAATKDILRRDLGRYIGARSWQAC